MPGRACRAHRRSLPTCRSRCILKKPQVYRCILINYTWNHPKYVFWSWQIASGTVFSILCDEARCEWLPSRNMSLRARDCSQCCATNAGCAWKVKISRVTVDRDCSKEISTKHLFQRAHSSHSPSTAPEEHPRCKYNSRVQNPYQDRNIDKQQHTTLKQVCPKVTTFPISMAFSDVPHLFLNLKIFFA